MLRPQLIYVFLLCRPPHNGILVLTNNPGCDGIVVGLPVTHTGRLADHDTDSQQGRRCRNFAQNVATLGADRDLLVYLVNERGTSLQADGLLAARGSARRRIVKGVSWLGQ